MRTTMKVTNVTFCDFVVHETPLEITSQNEIKQGNIIIKGMRYS